MWVSVFNSLVLFEIYIFQQRAQNKSTLKLDITYSYTRSTAKSSGQYDGNDQCQGATMVVVEHNHLKSDIIHTVFLFCRLAYVLYIYIQK